MIFIKQGGRLTIPVLAVLALLAFLFLGLVGCTETGPQIPPLTPDRPILAFGDSLTYGSGAQRNESYPAVLAEITGYTVLNAGAPGEESAQGLRRLPALLEKHQPQLLLLCHGGNDLLRKRPEAALEQNLSAMIEIAREHHAPVLMIGVPRPRLLFLESAELYSLVATRLQVPIESEILPSILSSQDLKSDGIHPNAKGYRLLAQAIAGKLRQNGALPVE